MKSEQKHKKNLVNDLAYGKLKSLGQFFRVIKMSFPSLLWGQEKLWHWRLWGINGFKCEHAQMYLEQWRSSWVTRCLSWISVPEVICMSVSTTILTVGIWVLKSIISMISPCSTPVLRTPLHLCTSKLGKSPLVSSVLSPLVPLHSFPLILYYICSSHLIDYSDPVFLQLGTFMPSEHCSASGLHSILQ